MTLQQVCDPIKEAPWVGAQQFVDSMQVISIQQNRKLVKIHCSAN